MKQKQTTPAEETEDKRPNETPDGESSDGETSDGESSDGLKEAGESMLSHLMALRKVLLISAAAVLIGFVLVSPLAEGRELKLHGQERLCRIHARRPSRRDGN